MRSWQPVDLTSDPHEAEYRGDPADLVDALEDLLTLMERPAWHAHASCRDRDPGDFYAPGLQRRAAAKNICAGCPVRAECAAAADDWGIWGGLDEQERRGHRSAAHDAA